MLSKYIKELTEYGKRTGLLPECEQTYAVNLLLDCFQEDSYEEPGEVEERPLEDILKDLLDEAVKRELITDSVAYRDLFDTKLMNCLTPRPAQVQETFRRKYDENPEEATDWFYQFSQNTDYIRRYRIRKDQKWKIDSPYGELDITINLSKPEKDPKAIAAARKSASVTYPKCQLCFENEGYAGRGDHPARETHRIIPITINDSKWGFQYSPYVYYNEHCIVFNSQHTPMKIERATFVKLFDFVKQFPHYMLGSNADLPIVGGSILSHDHFQGGSYVFAMAKAPYEQEFDLERYPDIHAGIVKWPMSVIRLQGRAMDSIVAAANHILTKWRGYSDSEVNIFSDTDGIPHNTITPIARMRGDLYELDLVLRNNITTIDCPLGLFHPHTEYHHIKKENIGLIEVMGLAVLPARLKKEMAELEQAILNHEDLRQNETVAAHAEWAEGWIPKYKITDSNIHSIIQKEIGIVFAKVLEDAGVYKRTDEGKAAFKRFIESL